MARRIRHTAILLSDFPLVLFLSGHPASDGLGLQVLLEALDAALPADTTVLVAPEGRVGAVEHPAVDAERARSNAARDVHASLHRPRYDRAREAVGAVVGDADGLVVVVERKDD